MDHDKIHLTAKLLEALDEGFISAESLIRHLIRHIQGSCDQCRDELAAWRSRSCTKPHGHRLESFADSVLRETTTDLQESDRLDDQLDELLCMDEDERYSKVERAVTRFRSPELAYRLSHQAMSEFLADPEEAASLCRLGLQILDRAPVSPFAHEIRAHLWAMRANVYRIQGDLDQASQGICNARAILGRQRSADLILKTEVQELEGVLLRHRCQWKEAERLLLENLRIWQLLRDHRRENRTLLALSALYSYSDRRELALEASSQVVESTSHRQNPLVHLLAVHHQVDDLRALGKVEQAAHLLGKHRPVYEACRLAWRTAGPHFHWIAGRLQIDLHRPKEAKRHLQLALNGFEDLKIHYDAEWVARDLQRIHPRN